MPIAGVVAGCVALIYAMIVVKFKANQTIAGIAFNTLALALSIYLIHSNANPQGASDKLQIQKSL